MSRLLGFVTSARSDFGLLRPLMAAAMADSRFSVVIYATGMHFSARHGNTLAEITEAGFGSCLECLPLPESADGQDGPATLARAMAGGLAAFANAFVRRKPDFLVVMGDRYDMLPAVVAALPFTIPVAHLAGGELTEGVIDDAIRHAVTKMSHLHFPTMPAYAQRLQRMGEEPWRITVTGEPGLDGLRDFPFRSRAEVLEELGLVEGSPISVFTFHPETLSPEGTLHDISTVLAVAAGMETQLVMTYPNADTSAGVIISAIETFAARRGLDRPPCRVVPHLGRRRYLDLLRQADCMVGNSSSGIVEAASFRLPVVDIGTRQGGRLAPANVLRAPVETAALSAAWTQALSPNFRASLGDLVNPYGDGHAVPRILDRLAEIIPGPDLLLKRFYDAGAPYG